MQRLAPALALWAAALAAPARCEEPPAASTAAAAGVEERLGRLERQVRSLQERLDAVQLEARRALREPGPAGEYRLAPAGEAYAGRTGFLLKSKEGDFLLRFEGLIQVDGRFYAGAGANAASYAPAAAVSAQAPAAGGFLLRRARPILAGTVFQSYDFFIQPDFGQNTAAISDAFIDFRPRPCASLRVGKFKPPLGLERLQTDSFTPFTERGLTADLIPQRDTGVEFFGQLDHDAFTYQASLTNGVADAALTPDSAASGSREGAWRLFAQPFKHAGVPVLAALGVGLAASYTGHNPAVPTYKTAVGQQQFLSYRSGTVFSGERSRLVPQADWYHGPVGLYGEWAESNQEARAGGVTARLAQRAWQAGAACVLTGEDASYNGLTPASELDAREGRWGAFELAARLHQLQVDPRTFSLGFADPASSASRATAWAVALNWYLDKFVRVSVDWEETWFKGGDGGGDRPLERALDARWQVAF